MEQITGVTLQQGLSPQMQKSLKILQAPIPMLSRLVQEELESNPVLEEDSVLPTDHGESDLLSSEDWDSDVTSSRSDQLAVEERRRRLFESAVVPQSLYEFLMGQVLVSGWDLATQSIAKLLIGNVDAQGYYRGSNTEIALQCRVSEARVEEVLRQVQQFDPPGVATRNLSECLERQLEMQGQGDGIAITIVREYLDLLAKHKLPEIAQRLKIGVIEVRKAAEWIRSLNPKPGNAFMNETESLIIPDAFVEQSDKGWIVRLNEEALPKLRIGNFYKDLLGDGNEGRDARDYLRDKIREGRFFIRSIEQRQQTILRIANEIIRHQIAFLEKGPSALHPMTMSVIARALDIHETTVSRTVNGKYLSTPWGLFEMRFFFSFGLSTNDGFMSNRSIKDAVTVLIAEEDTGNPLSDQRIQEILSERGIKVARRTVSKYREESGILPKHLRRKF